MTTTALSHSLSSSQRLAIGMLAFLLGSFLIYGVGLSHDMRAHNAAHDTRHAIGFPCH